MREAIKMMKKITCISLFLLNILFLVSCTQQSDFPVMSGEYLGQEPPGLEGELFAQGIMSTGMSELNAVFFPGGKEVVYSVNVGPMKWMLVMIREENGRWTRPEIAPFSGEHGGVDPFISFDGNTIYFCSNRPRSGQGEPEDDYDIWYVTRTDTGWSEPANIGLPINSDTHEFYPSLTREGTMYFQSRREGGIGYSDIYRTKLVDGKYEEAELLPKPVNSPDFEGDTFIAPDESYIIVSTFRKEDNIGQSDLYISFCSEDGSWLPLKNMGERINSEWGENCQILSPCGKYLFYTSRRVGRLSDATPLTYETIKKAWTEPQNGNGDIYWVDARIIEEFRPEKLKK
jgi:hypothetical protein